MFGVEDLGFRFQGLGLMGFEMSSSKDLRFIQDLGFSV